MTEWFDNMSLPSWSDLDDDPDTDDSALFPFDPTRLHSLQFHVVTRPGVEAPYDFCVSDFMWLDADGNEVLPE